MTAPRLFLALTLFLTACASPDKPAPADSSAKAPALSPELKVFSIETPPMIGTRPGGKVTYLGGFSGLVFEGKVAETGELRFLTHTDRGPNEWIPSDVPTQGERMVFTLPEFQPQWIRLKLDPKTSELQIVERIGLRKKDGSPLTGRPNVAWKKDGPVVDEVPIDISEKVLSTDAMGLDLEALTKADDGTYWMGDEYRPSIVHFSADGKILERYVPKSKDRRFAKYGREELPEEYADRRLNRGFEGLTYHGGKVYAFIQSALDLPGSKAADGSRSDVARVLEFNTKTLKVTGEYFFVFDDRAADKKVGDAVALPNGDFLFIEQTGGTGDKAEKKIYRLSLHGATNLRTDRKALPLRSRLELTTTEERTKAGLVPLKKELVVDLAKLGYTFAPKAEGLTVVDDETLAVASDNDFMLKGTEKSTLTLIKVKSLGLAK